MQANIRPNMEEEVGGAVQTRPVPGDPAQLHGVGGVRPPRGPPEQHPRPHHQRRRHRHPARLHRRLPHLLRPQEARQGPLPRPPRGRLRRPPPRPRRLPRPRAPQARRHRRRPLRRLLHHDLRRPSLRHGKNGDKDEERGVHAVLPVPGVIRERCLLDCLCINPDRLVHHYSERDRGGAGDGAADPVRRVLQIDAEADCGEEGRGEG
ncbi:unnamed protein product [Linum tenue]|uniref:Uncharacterized protein n=1 Tax=Linum tenue TaxID=586396 RepID=A0AAV0JFW3_9ROSI|nr:unnamed protein product [Linum tenue]